MDVIAIDPGTCNTGVVYMNERGIICAKTIHYQGAIKQNQEALLERARLIAADILDFMADKPHDMVVIEGFTAIPSIMSSNTYQTPYLCGYLQRLLDKENLTIQTSTKVFRGQWLRLRDDIKQGREAIPNCKLLKNEHLRAAGVHGWYYLKGQA